MTKTAGLKKAASKGKATIAKGKQSITSFFGKKKSTTTTTKKSAAPKSPTRKQSSAGSSKENNKGSPTPSTEDESPMKSSPLPKASAARKPSGPPAAFNLKSPIKPQLADDMLEGKFPCDEIGEGWLQQIKRRDNAKKKTTDRYYINPDGKKFRSMVEVNNYLNGKEGAEESEGKPKAIKKKSSSSPTTKKKSSSSPIKKMEASTANTIINKSKQIQMYKVGTKVSKKFEDPNDNGRMKPFSGVIKSYDTELELYNVQYEDGDSEDMSGKEVSEILVKGGGKKKASSKSNNNKRKEKSKKTINDDDSSDEEVVVAKKKARTSSKKSIVDSDDEDMDEESDSGEAGGDKKKKNVDMLMTSKSGRKTKKVVYAQSDTEDDGLEDSDEDMDIPKKKKAKASKKKKNVSSKAAKGKKKKGGNDSDSDEFELGSEEEDEDEESFAADSESEDEMQVDSESEDEAPKKKKAKRFPLLGRNDGDSASPEDQEYANQLIEGEISNERKKMFPAKKGGKKAAAKKKKSSKKSKASGGGDGDDGDDGGDEGGEGGNESDDDDDDALDGSIEALCAKKAKDINVLNNPQKFPVNGPYVEPVGIDATDGIVEGIVGGMVQKVGKLLLGTLKREDDEREMGELNFPIKLNTACSGTDAPSIALGLVQESLDRFCSTSEGDENDDEKKEHGFTYEHNMSCEIEPFKQAYIGRNFPEVLLFPDITKLTEKETVVDVYGREQTIPEGNIFIAGTSCKDFSMLKSCHRKDIEDKGQSGETFLAAIEYLEQEKPKVAIFENVLNAPWTKMQEYIEGRLNLRLRNETKNITGKGRANADKDLKFTVNDDCRYVVEEVPKQIGARAGCVVEGFVKYGDDPSNVQPLRASKSDKGKTVSLEQLAKEHGITLHGNGKKKKGDPEELGDVLVMEKKARYRTHLVKLDTKDYGLPQTRNRQYLFVWRTDDPSDNLGEYFQLIMDHLKTPLLHSMEAFMLPPSHDRIRCFREALRSGPGLLMAKERAKELDFFDWDLSGVKDLAYHLNYRKKHGINERSRPLTQWNTRGRRQVAPGVWPELVAVWNMRRCDLIDSFSATCNRDNISRDPLHHSFTWDLSQNVHRTSVRNSVAGVSGCVTPGGELLLANKGRTMMGFEKLLLQGIPFSRLALGPETETQLSDLAGNAMSLPVVCATMLSAICAPQLRREVSNIEEVSLSKFGLSQKYDSSHGAVLSERGDLHDKKKLSTQEFADVFDMIANELAEEAHKCSVLCGCESAGQITQADKILECTDCGFGICHTCTSRHQIDSHHLKEIISSKSERVNPHEFEMKLRCAAPSVLVLGKSWEDTIPECKGLESYSFQLQRVDRNRGHWLMTYGAWEDNGTGRQVAEIRIALGQIGSLDENVGLAAYVKCFAPAIRTKNPKRGVLGDSARLILKIKGKSIESGSWTIKGKAIKQQLNVVGSDPVDSNRIQVGINDTAKEALKEHKPQKQFTKDLPKSRNDLIHYHKKWKTWPGTIVISGDDNDKVNGSYKKMSCQHTVVLSALWIREATESSPALYLYIRPDVSRTGLDVAVISTTPNYRDKMEICQLNDWIPENALVEKTHTTQVKFFNWEAVPQLKLEVPEPTLVTESSTESFHDSLNSEEAPVLCEMNGLTNEAMKSILQHSSDEGDVVPIDLVGKMGSRNAKRLSILAAPSLLKYAAESKLPLELLNWYKLSHPEKCSFGLCEDNYPSRPQESWTEIVTRTGTGKKMKETRKGVRAFDAEESNEFYKKLLARPPVFEASAGKANGKLTIRMNPSVAGHQAAAHLVRGRGLSDDYVKSVNVEYSLSELSRMGEPSCREFQVPNSDAYDEATVDGMELPLYSRQAKALTRMQAIEEGKVKFDEEERSEHILNGVGWCLIGRATASNPLKGGVLGDAIGSGKTVVTIALILDGIKKARANRNIAEGKSGATLIVVPPGLVKQWDDERKKFTKKQLRSIIIDSTATLKRFSVKEICEADIVIVPASIIEERGKTATSRPYTELMAAIANADEIPPAPANGHKEAPTIEGTWVRNMASGPQIYVGNDAKQKHRDEQAFYGHRYSEAIKKLRSKKFSSSERGVPLEYFTWDRIVVDECHECLVSTKSVDADNRAKSEFSGQARRGAREFLGVGCTDSSSRPLMARTAFWGLTGTPLLATESRVTELANLMGGTYLMGSAHHWRKEERESGRDIFLNQQEEGSKSREYRCAIHESCHAYVREACQRNRGEKLLVELERKKILVNMTSSEGTKFLSAIKETNLESFSINPEQLGDKVGNGLSVTASSTARHSALFNIIDSIQAEDASTKIIIFASVHGYQSALSALQSRKEVKFSHVDDSDSVLEQNEIISHFRHTDATDEDRARPRILLLSFSQAAGHNLQEACHNVIMYDPMYSGSDAVADASVEEQALGRVMRQGQTNDVTCHRILVKGPNGEPCLDDVIVDRNEDEEVLRAATSNFD